MHTKKQVGLGYYQCKSEKVTKTAIKHFKTSPVSYEKQVDQK